MCVSQNTRHYVVTCKVWMHYRDNVNNQPARRSSSVTRKCGPSCHRWRNWSRVLRNVGACVAWPDCGRHQVVPLLPETVYQRGIFCSCPSSRTSVCDRWTDAAVQSVAELHIFLLLACSCHRWRWSPSCSVVVQNNPSFDDPSSPLSETTQILHESCKHCTQMKVLKAVETQPWILPSRTKIHLSVSGNGTSKEMLITVNNRKKTPANTQQHILIAALTYQPVIVLSS